MGGASSRAWPQGPEPTSTRAKTPAAWTRSASDEDFPGVVTRQLQGCSVGPAALVVPDRQALVDRDHFLAEIFMVPADRDHGALPQKGENDLLHLYRFLPAVEDIAQDDQFVRLRIGEIPRLIQRLVQFGIKAVNIGGDAVFQPRQHHLINELKTFQLSL